MCSKPRVIAAEIKKDISKDVIKDKTGPKPRIAGELALVGGVSSEPHWVEVREGQLLVYPGSAPSAAPTWRLPLRRLNLQPAASGRPRGFSLTRHGDLAPIATFQVDNEIDYSRWVRTLAAELLKQTPLGSVKFLDILGITATIPDPREQRSLSPEYCSEPDGRTWGRWGTNTPEAPRTLPAPNTLPRNWYHKTVEISQPLSLIITEEPKPEKKSSFRRALSFDSSPEDSVDGRFRVVDTICKLAKQSKNCFRACEKSISNENLHKLPSVAEDAVGKNKVKSLLKNFLAQDGVKDVTSPGPLHPLDIKDDGRTGRPPLPDVIKDLPPCERRSRARTRTPTPLRMRGKSVDVLPSTEDSQVAELIARCQQGDRYVPVKDKRLLFESLGRAASQPRFVLSSDNLADLGDPFIPEPPRTQSLHDLSGNNVAVKEICRYFEQRGGSRGELPARSPSPECRLRLVTGGAKVLALSAERRQAVRAERRLGRLRQHIAECEQTIWRLQDQSDKLALNRRGSSTRIQVAVECRLEEERVRLKKLQEDQFRAQQEVEEAADQFGITATKVRHLSDVR